MLQAAADEPYKVLVFHKTGGFRHTAGINAGITTLTNLGASNNFTVDATQDSAVFTEANLAQYRTVVFLSTTGNDILTAGQKVAFENYIKGGGGYFGIHAASDTEYNWPWYANLVGAYFNNHPPGTPQGKIFVEDRVHPMTADMGDEIVINEEWYNFRANPRANVHVLASADVTSFSGSNMANRDHPLAWCHDSNDTTGAGRAAYTALGHDGTNYGSEWFQTMLLAGVETTAGVVEADCGASLPKNYDIVSLDDNTLDPLMLDIADNGDVFYIQITGALRVIKKDTGAVHTVATLPVTTSNESGLLGLALDPNFSENNWVYLFHSPTSPNVDRLSRFTFDPATNTLVAGSEKVVLDVPVQRAECCHHGGSMVFDADGNLFIATGDATNPFASSGYSPTDYRAGRAAWDAARTSGNTNSLSGKVLKITPQEDGTYTIPEGNLFAPGTEKTRPEIFAMGMRNPFRMGVDPATGHVMVADYGPDANSANANRGPANTVEWNLMTQAGNYGWPFCTGNNAAYNRWDFANNTAGAPYECATGVINDSPNNDGLTQLPPAIPATIWYQYGGTSGNYPEVGGGGAPMAGPVYRYDPAAGGDAWPEYWDGKAIWSEWNRSTTYANLLTSDGENLQKVTNITSMFTLPAGSQRSGNIRIMDSKFGPDGSLYVIDWGSGWDKNTNSGIYRIDYLLGNRSPIASAEADKLDGGAPLTVSFSSEGSSDPEGTTLSYLWDFGDGETSTEANPTHTFAEGVYRVQLTVTDEGGKSNSSSLDVVSGNNRPVVTITSPQDGQMFEFGDQIDFELTVTDVEDGSTTDETISCDLVKIVNRLGHYSVGDSHTHPMSEGSGCSGTVQTLADGGHGGDIWLYWIISADYTDNSAGALGEAGKLTGSASVVLQTKIRQAEHFNATGRLAGSTSTGDPGVVVEPTADPLGGTNQIGYVEPGDWVSFERMNLAGIDSVQARVAGATGADLELRWNAPDGELIATLPATPTAGWTDYATSSVELGDVPAGSGTIYLVAKNDEATGSVVNVNQLTFVGKGATANEKPTLTSASVTPLEGSAPLRVDLAAAAVDPEGSAVSYHWNLGTTEGDEVTGATGSFVYTTPGTYQVALTVTDEGGAFATRYFEVKVNRPPLKCLGGRSDAFDGDALNEGRWEVIRPDGNLSVADGNLVIPTANADIYQNTNTAPNIVLQPMPEGPWEIVTKVGGTFNNAYQQGGLIVYGNDDNYAKLVFSGRSTGGASAANRIVQYGHESNASMAEVNTAQLGASFPETAWLKLTYDGTNLGAEYSADGDVWTSLSTINAWTNVRKTLAGFGDNIRVGIVALANTNNVTNASFDFFQVTPDEGGDLGPNDEFDGPEVSECRWEVVRPDPTKVSFADGQLQIETTSGEPNVTNNVLLQNQPEGDHWMIETKVDATTYTGSFQQAGLVAYADDNWFVKVNFIKDTGGTGRIILRTSQDGALVDPRPQVDVGTDGVFHLRLERQGDNFAGYFSADGTTWTKLAQTVANAPTAATGKVGVFAAGVSAAGPVAKFDYFRVVEIVPDTVAPVTVATVSDTDPAVVTLTATDEGGSGVAVTQYRIGTQTWTTYTGPFEVARTSVAQSVEFRSIDGAGNEESVQSVDVPAAVPTAPQGDATFTSACMGAKSVVTLRYRNTSTETVKVTMTTPYGEKVFASVAPKGLVANNFLAPNGVEAGEATITVTTLDGQPRGSLTQPIAAKSCG